MAESNAKNSAATTTAKGKAKMRAAQTALHKKQEPNKKEKSI